jgi:SAM-dependent methyltransferase/uncharacterized protein YbaR (Trm112 family)
MKRRVVELLQCPGCNGSLDLQVLSEQPEKVDVPVKRPRCARYCALLDVAIGPESDPARFDCQGCYGRDVRDGFLSCSGCHLVFPVIDGVPRLLRQAHEDYREFFFERREHVAASRGQERLAKTLDATDPAVFDRRTHESFSLQWEHYQYDDKTWFKDDVSLRQEELLRSFDLPAPALVGALILDVGCGNGRLTATMSRYGAEVVGMDLSRSVARANENRQAVAGDRAPFVHFVQGNIMEPPLRPESFDHIHTSGVLHHTPDTWRAFASFLKLGRPGARTYVQLYRRRELWVRMVNTPLRFVTTRLPVGLLYRLCYVMVPVHTALVKMVAAVRGEHSPIGAASRRERAVSLFDHLSPHYQYRYTPEQVRQRFVDAGLRDVKDVTLANEARQMVAFVGVKGAD